MAAKQSALWHHFDDFEHQREANLLGMWLFMATEVLVFGALFTGYAAYRSRFAGSFEEASQHLNLMIAAVNTIVLLSSSLTMALGVRAAQLGRQARVARMLVLTALLGLVFLGLKAVEYRADYLDRLVPGLAFDPDKWPEPGQVQLFLVFYFVMTGLHAVHLAVGISVISVLAVMARRGVFSPEHYAPVEMWGLYWHFVDVVWIFLLPLLYLVGTHHRLY